MATKTQTQLVAALLKRHGQTFSDHLGIRLKSNTPSVLFRWLCASLLFSARIRHNIAGKAAKALAKKRWTTAKKMAGATWSERTHVLHRSGYARYDEKTSRALGEAAELTLKRYAGDLRNLRALAHRNPKRERELLMEFKGIGQVGASIFLREMQLAWKELFPFADATALKAARQLGLPSRAEPLSQMVDKKDFPNLLAALIRWSLEHKSPAQIRKSREAPFELS